MKCVKQTNKKSRENTKMRELYPERHLGNYENALKHICKQVQNFLFLLNANSQTNKNKLNKH